MGHWYKEDGSFDETIGDLRDARKAGNRHFEGASTITKRLPNFMLDQWKTRQAALAAVKVPRNPGETDNDWADRAIAESQKQVQEAADVGVDFHDIAEAALTGRPLVPIQGLEESSRQLYELLEPYKGQLITETVVPTTYGFGGRCDAFNESWLLDYKSQNVRKKPEFYPSYIVQKALYREAIMSVKTIKPRCLTVVVSRVPENQGAWDREWEEEETLLAAYQGLTLVESWLAERNYRLDKLAIIAKRKDEIRSELGL